jgi:small subunit ribosomal protein S7
MSRRKNIQNINKKSFCFDTKYSNKLLGKFISYVMLHGNRVKASFIVYSALDILSRRVDLETPVVLQKVLNNVRPIVEIKSRRIGGSTYQIPVELDYTRSASQALKWLIQSSRLRRDGNTMITRLSNELFDAFKKRGLTFRKKENIHKMAEANKAFSHYKW